MTTDGDGVHLHVIGKAAHGMEPKNGINAGTYLALFLKNYAFAGDAKAFLNLLGDQLHNDSRVTKLGLAFSDDIMGELTMNVGVMAFDAEKGGHIVLNFRYPKGIGSDDIEKKHLLTLLNSTILKSKKGVKWSHTMSHQMIQL